MIHYHGGRHSTWQVAVEIWGRRHALISYADPNQISIAAEVAQYRVAIPPVVGAEGTAATTGLAGAQAALVAPGTSLGSDTTSPPPDTAAPPPPPSPDAEECKRAAHCVEISALLKLTSGYARLVAQLDHALWMIAQMHKGMQPGVNAWDAQKLNRWLGFIQGVLWMAGAYTIDELRQQTRIFAQSEASREA